MDKGRLARLGPWLLLALVPLQAGCLAVAAGAAAGGAAAAGYVYLRGALYRTFPTSLQDGVSASRAALTDLRLPLLEETNDQGMVTLTSKTGNGMPIRLLVESSDSALPVEGPLTRISVRVGFSGDDEISARILDQITAHLTAPASAPGTAPQAPAPVASAPVGVPETPPPPLAGGKAP